MDNKAQKQNRVMPGGPGAMFGKAPEKAKDLKGTLKNLIIYLKPHWINLVIVLVFAISSTVFSIVSPKILGQATNEIVNDYINIKLYEQIVSKIPSNILQTGQITDETIINMIPQDQKEKLKNDQIKKIKQLDFSKKPNFNFDMIQKIIIELILLYILSTLFGYIQSWIMSGVTQKVSYELRRNISEKINKLPLKYFDKRTFGETLSKVTNDVDTISQNLNQSLSQIVSSLVTIIGILIMMLSISPLLTLIAIIVLPIGFSLMGLIFKGSQEQFVKQQTELGKLNGHIEEMYGGHMLVKLFNGEKDSIHRFNIINNELYHSAWKSQFFSGLMFPIMNFVGNLGYVGVAVAGGWLAIKGQIQIGDIQAFIQYVQQFNQPIAQTANISNVLQSTAAAAERVFEFLNETEETELTAETIELKTISGEVQFKDVIFGYDKDNPVIKNFNAEIKPGQRVAIVGPTGAGKTTIVNLLMRFYDPDSGSITIDGIDIRNVKRSDIRKLFGMVLQDTWLFNGSIKQNIAYSKPEATMEEIDQAAKEAHADHFIKSLPEGYDMILNEEADNISQGEKQLITIARAMLAKTPMLILDEATSSVDTRTEMLIQKAMDNLMKDKTSFVIAHRLSTIRDADLILVMNNGNIVEQGKHEELLKKNGFYASIYNSQFEKE